MNNRFTYKQRIYFLGVIFFIGILVAYGVAIKPTVTAKKELKQLEADIKNIDTAPQKRAVLLKKIEAYDRLIGAKVTDQKFEQQQILEYISNYCMNTETAVREFPKVHSYIKNNYSLNTITFVVEGNFKQLLNLLFLIETDLKIGSILSVDFYSEEEIRTKKKRLYLRVYIQTINNSSL